MILLAKLTLGILWFVAFLATCAIMTLTFPLIVVFEKMQSLSESAAS